MRGPARRETSARISKRYKVQACVATWRAIESSPPKALKRGLSTLSRQGQTKPASPGRFRAQRCCHASPTAPQRALWHGAAHQYAGHQYAGPWLDPQPQAATGTVTPKFVPPPRTRREVPVVRSGGPRRPAGLTCPSNEICAGRQRMPWTSAEPGSGRPGRAPSRCGLGVWLL